MHIKSRRETQNTQYAFETCSASWRAKTSKFTEQQSRKMKIPVFTHQADTHTELGAGEGFSAGDRAMRTALL